MEPNLSDERLLRDAPEIDGYRVLPPCLLYGRIGKGGFGAVYRARHLKLDIDVAVKCMLDSLVGEDEQFVARFEREAVAAARVNHPNLVRVYDVDHNFGVHYIVMELVKGETARERVRRKGPLPAGEAVAILLGAARGLAAAHDASIVHRDVKPDNVLISAKGEVKLTDLGLARIHDGESGDSAATMSQRVMGTPRYMPPEQWRNLAEVGQPGDVWALGATLYFLLAGTDALEGLDRAQLVQCVCADGLPDLAARVKDVPRELVRIVERATAVQPSDRYSTAKELVAALAGWTKGEECDMQLADPAIGNRSSRCAAERPPSSAVLTRARRSLGSLEGRGNTLTMATMALSSGRTDGDERRSRRGLRLALALTAALLAAAGTMFFTLGSRTGVASGSGEPTGGAPAAAALEAAPVDPAGEATATAAAPDVEPRPTVEEIAPAKPAAPAGFELLGKNPQGLDELRHEASGIVFVSLPGGTFLMGGDRAPEFPPHEVTLDPFLIAKHEVRQSDWNRVMAPERAIRPEFDSQRGGDLPALNVSWKDAAEFCKRTGLRLPSEAQWEYACRGGAATLYHSGDSLDDRTARYNYDKNAATERSRLERGELAPISVDALLPNAFGLYHVHGNVAEWCADYFDARFYEGAASTGRNPVCLEPPAGAGQRYSPRALRGGSFLDAADDCTSASRRGWPEKLPVPFAGLRPVWSESER